MKHLVNRFLFLVLILALVLPITIVTAEAPAYVEGIEVAMHGGYSPSQHVINLRGIKLVDEDYRHSTVEFHYTNRNPSGTLRRVVNTVFVVPEDPDWLEVSEDLGWGGLDAEVWATMYTYDASGVATAAPVQLKFHLELYYTAAHSVYRDGYFYRSADVRGTVNIGGTVINFSRPNGVECPVVEPRPICIGHFDSGYNFTDQWPGL